MVKRALDLLKDWQPRDHAGMTPLEHMEKMYSFGTPGTWYYFNPVVTIISAVLVWGFVIWAMVEQEYMAEDTGDIQSWVTDIWNWLYMGSQNFWILVLFWLLFKYFNLKLGADDDEPEFSDITYFAMLFSCGVATGLWYYTAEAMWHYEGYGTPRWTDQYMWNDNTRAEHALMVTWFHWGLHGWIPYVVVGATVALLHYRRGFPMAMRFTLYPLIGEMVYGWMGDCVEILSILCTIFGVCTSLGLGSMQINKALVRLDHGTFRGKDEWGCDSPAQLTCDGRTGMVVNKQSQIWIIVVVTGLAISSVVAGLKKGIAVLSLIAFFLSVFILLTVLFLDETWYILNALTSTLGYYIWYLPRISFHTDAWEELGHAYEGKGGAPDGRGGLKGWMNSWTIFYWGWWISWGPFVGTFLARISKGRRMGPFIVASLILPSVWSFAFTGIFGAAQIRISRIAEAAGLDMSDAYHTYGRLSNPDEIGFTVPLEDGSGTYWQPRYEGITRLYNLATEDVVFEHICFYGDQNYATFMTVIILICIVLYFVTSSDSASYIVDILAANGHEEPPVIQKIFWAATEGIAAIALIVSADDEDPTAALNAVKAVPIILGLPFTFLLFWMCQSLLILCKEETGKIPKYRKNFGTFILNLEKESALAIVVPFWHAGNLAAQVGTMHPYYYVGGFASIWIATIAFLCAGTIHSAYWSFGAAMYIMFGTAVAGLRTAYRTKLGIEGDMVSDWVVGVFGMPMAIGQMCAETTTVPGPE
mmetsp:Transcript_66932/g.145453  ORF Transcript_66932/g.145453 Transcript_66932/m.145453 type:complete len:757 (+) Transcript_66932:80-2350(+)